MFQLRRLVISSSLVVLFISASVLGVGLPRPKNCGNVGDSRISGGEAAGLDEFPWVALIRDKDDIFCGGTVINERYVLTAAHCVVGMSGIGVRLGEYDLNNPDIDCVGELCADPPVEIYAEKVFVHEAYNKRGDSGDDIALIKLNQDITFTKYIQPVCLPVDSAERSRSIGGANAIVTGWGMRASNDTNSPVKLKANLHVFTSDECNKLLETPSDLQICAGGVKGTGTCKGDSGGPLMQLVGNHFFQYGIVSYGWGICGQKERPTVFANVPKYIDWIEAHMNGEQSWTGNVLDKITGALGSLFS